MIKSKCNYYMKKYLFLFLFLIIPFVGSFAQKGMKAVGLDACGGFAQGEFIIGPIADFQYNITDNFRIQAAGGYFFGTDNKGGGALIQLSGHYLFGRPNVIRPFADFGVDYGSVYTRYYRYIGLQSSRTFDFFPYMGGHIGFGVDYRVEYHLTLRAGAQLALVSCLTEKDGSDYVDSTRGHFYLGIAYTF